MKVDQKDIAARLAKESLKILKGSVKKGDLIGLKRLGAEFTAKVVEQLVHDVLNTRPEDAENMTDEELYKFTSGQFSNFKGMLQEGIADGFGMALRRFSRKPVDYHCWIEIVDPKFANKIPC